MTGRHIMVLNVFFAPFSYGGATVVAEEVSKALVRHSGYQITAVSLCARSELRTYTVVRSEVAGITNYVINVPAGRSYRELYDNPKVEEILRELMEELAPDVVHAHCLQDIGAGVLKEAHDLGIPIILSVHDFWWICERQFMVNVNKTYCGQNPVVVEDCRGCVVDFDAAARRFTYLQEIGKLPARVTYPSQFAKDLCAASGFAPQTGMVWKNGVRLPDDGFDRLQAARRARDPRLTIGYVGGPSQIKGWPLIREAFRKLDDPDIRVIVVDGSRDGGWWSDQDLKGLPGQWEIYPRFIQQEMDAFYAQIDVLLFMSQWKETFGLAIREALARGITVIQTDSGGTTEHGTVAQDALIPIGAPAEVLTGRLMAAIAAHPDHPAPKIVTSYEEQATEFAALVEDVLARAC